MSISSKPPGSSRPGSIRPGSNRPGSDRPGNASPRSHDDAEVDAKILTSIARWLRDTHGDEELARVASHAELRPEHVDGRTHWISHHQFEAFLQHARDLMSSDEEFTAACVHRFGENVGALRHMTWALTPDKFFDASLKMSHLVVRRGHFERVSSSAGHYVVRYKSGNTGTRLACLVRMAQMSIAPTLWGLPQARIRESSCLAHGDASCEYDLRWTVTRRPLWIIFGGLIGAAIGLALGDASIGPLLARVEHLTLATLAGGSIATLLEQRRAIRLNASFAEETAQVLRQTATEEAEARAEILALSARQRDWSRLLEEQLSERSAAVEKMIAALGESQQQRVSTLRSFSHDLRNPLFVLKGNLALLRDDRISEGERAEILSDFEAATSRIEQLLGELMNAAVADTMKARESRISVAIPPLTESYRRRLRALAHGRDIKVSVFGTREAPAQIRIDPLILDRIVDNLLTNAAKYTERGSIILEIGGTPGHLTLKLSDTGRGIANEALDGIFKPRENGPRTALSQGFGLSGVVQLLGALGGRLEVMTRAGTGTTFWAHIPENASLSSGMHPAVDEAGRDFVEGLIRRVVTIRKAPALAESE